MYDVMLFGKGGSDVTALETNTHSNAAGPFPNSSIIVAAPVKPTTIKRFFACDANMCGNTCTASTARDERHNFFLKMCKNYII